MIDTLLYLLCGLSAGILGGYLGLGGGIVMVPFLTVGLGIDIKDAVPVSAAAIVVNSFSASTEYLKKQMVDLEMIAILATFLVAGGISGSLLNGIIPTGVVRLIFTIVLVYTAFSLLKGRKNDTRHSVSEMRSFRLPLCIVLVFGTGILAGLIGVGGGVIIVPALFLIVGIPLSTARGTSSFITGFSAAAATAVYFFSDRIDLAIVSPVILGIIVGGKIGGYFGALAKPKIVRIIFFVVMLYLAIKLGYEPVMEML